MHEPEVELVLDILMRRYPSYTAETVLSEHSELVEALLFIAGEEAAEQERQRKEDEAKARQQKR